MNKGLILFNETAPLIFSSRFSGRIWKNPRTMHRHEKNAREKPKRLLPRESGGDFGTFIGYSELPGTHCLEQGQE
jgi:hypothetical protein